MDAIQLTDIATQVRACTKCQLCQNPTRRQAVPGAGNPSARLFVLGEKPSWMEDRDGVPMVGKAGELFTALLIQAGLSRADCYLTNLIKCLPPKGHRLSIQELDTCRPYLDQELALVKPLIVLTLGNMASSLWFPPSSGKNDNRIGNIHGTPKCVQAPWGGPLIILPTYNPAAATYRSDDDESRSPLIDVIRKDLQTAAQILQSSIEL